MAVAERLRADRRQRRSHRLRIIQPDQLAPFLLEVRHAYFGQRFERGAKPFARLPRIGCNAPLLAAITCQEDHDAVRFAQLVSAEDEGFGRAQRHAVAAYCTLTRKRRNIVASPRNDANPTTSVKVVMKTDDAS